MANRLFDLFKKSGPTPIGTATNQFFPMSFVDQFLAGAIGSNDAKFLEYYLSVPQLQATINYRADLFATMNIKLRKIDGKEVDSHKVLDLLHDPNPMQSFKELAKQYSIGKDIFGNSYLHPVFFKDPQAAQALYCLPGLSAEVMPADNKLIPFNQFEIDKIIQGYKFKFDGTELLYPPEDIFHSNDIQMYTGKDSKHYLKGLSKIQPLAQVCQNIITSYEARGIIQGNAPAGIISNRTKDGTGTTTMMPDEKEKVQEALKQYGYSKRKSQFITSSADLSFISMAINMANLKLLEGNTADQMTIANAYMVPVNIFKSDTTFANLKEAKKQVYEDATIPEATGFCQILSKGFKLEEQGMELYPDFSHVKVLQDDLSTRATMHKTSVEALSKAFADGAISLEEYTEQLEYIGMIKPKS